MFDTITNNETYKQVLKDSCGGVMYNVANEGKYNTTELQEIYNRYNNMEKESMDGIMTGAFNFLKII